MNLVHTYSIVAISDDKKEIGVGVQSHWFAVGAACPWIEPGVGAIATQSIVEVSYGPKGLTLLREGNSTDQVLSTLLDADKDRETRQVAILDASGKTATHTGKRCIPEAGHLTGGGYSVQANLMENDSVWPAMASAFERSRGELSERIFTALQAAQDAGGDIRGKQSAAMLIAENIRDEKPWSHITTNVRVDDHPSPLMELRRLLDIEKAYNYMDEGDMLLSCGKFEEARSKYGLAAELAPAIDELPFWEAVSYANLKKMDLALPIFRKIFEVDENWAKLIMRLPAVGLLTDDRDVIENIMSLLKEGET